MHSLSAAVKYGAVKCDLATSQVTIRLS